MIINYPCKWEMSGSDIQPAFHSSLPVPPPSAFLPGFFFFCTFCPFKQIKKEAVSYTEPLGVSH